MPALHPADWSHEPPPFWCPPLDATRRRLWFGGAPVPQPVPGSAPPPPPQEIPPSETPPEVNDPAVPHEHEPVRDPQPFSPGALH